MLNGRRVQLQREAVSLRDGRVSDVIVGGANAARGHDKVVVRREPADGGNDVRVRVRDGLDPVEGNAKGEKVLRQEMGVCVDDFAVENLVADDQTGCGLVQAAAFRREGRAAGRGQG